MKIDQAILLANEGQKVRRKSWPIGKYITGNAESVVTIGDTKKRYLSEADDHKANDWELFTETADKSESNKLPPVDPPPVDPLDNKVSTGSKPEEEPKLNEASKPKVLKEKVNKPAKPKTDKPPKIKNEK